MAADPTQLLLTALGRFQRQVAKAESGVPNRDWTDECMEQLISAIEIALGAGWEDIQRALTDTARVLQTFEDAGIADESVPFLQDSYEILCLMVGDLIVDNVRSGVMQKWEQRYARAVEDLRQLGLEPVEDDGTAPEEAPAPAQEAAAVPDAEPDTVESKNYQDDETAETAPGDAPVAAAAPDLEENLPQFEEPAFAVDDEAEEVAIAEADIAEDAAWTREEDDAGEMDGGADDAYETGVDDTDGEAEETPESSIVPFAKHSAPPQDEAGENIETAEAEAAPFALPDEEEFETQEPADALLIDDTLDVTAETAPAAAETDADEELVYESYETVNDSTASAAPAASPEPMLFDFGSNEEIAQEAAAGTLSTETDDLNDADEAEMEEGPAAIDAAMDATDDEAEMAAAENEEVMAEMESIETVEETATELPAEAAEVAEVAADELRAEYVEETLFQPAPAPPSPAESLLHTAQAAMARGDLADAKVIALRLAADMARMEAQRAGEALAEAEARRDATRDAIVNAEQQVADAEFGVESQQNERAQRETDLENRHAANAKLQEEAGAIERGIAELEDQIRQLQAQRDGEAERLAAVSRDHGDGKSEADIIGKDIAALQEQEADAARMLEAARARVDGLREEEGTREGDIKTAQKALARQNESVADIERTITHVMPEAPAEEQD